MEIAHVCSHGYAQGSKDWPQIQDQRGYANCRPCLAFPQRQDSFKSTQPGGDPFAASEDPQCSIRVLAQERGSLDRKWHPLCPAHGQNPCLIFVWRSCKKEPVSQNAACCLVTLQRKLHMHHLPIPKACLSAFLCLPVCISPSHTRKTKGMKFMKT